MPRKGSAAPTHLDDPDVRRWFDNLARGSRATADVHLRRLAALTASLRATPAELAQMDEKQLYNRFLDFVAAEEKRGVAGSYIVRTLKAGKSWLQFNGKKLERPIRVSGAKATPSLDDERVPMQEELRKIILAGTPRIRTACALIAFSGLRPEVLGNYLGTDGLILDDFKELKIGKAEVAFAAIPTLIRVRPELSKNSNGYLSFLSAEGCEYVKQYLDERLRAGEKLGPETDLIHPDRAGKRFIRTINIGDAIRTAIRGAGFKWRPYVLRHYFDTQLLTAESKGRVAHDFRVYWMGHTGSIDARYTTNKGQVPKAFLDEMRAAYKRCEPFLSTTPVPEPNDGASRVLRALMIERGYPKEKAEKLDIGAMTDEELGALFKKLAASTLPTKRSEKAFAVDEVPRMLDAGWEFVSPLNGSLAVLRSPPGTDAWLPTVPRPE
ncbi:MAG: site-specific integrase [Thermoplasmata archaeon]|nr:site-specific integrase [Thermoplasmata archaeon]